MYVRQSTWIEAGPRPRPRRPVARAAPALAIQPGRGLGQDEFLTDADYMAALPSSVGVPLGTPETHGLCFLPLFPFFGQRVYGAPTVCRSIVTVPDPWALVITVGLGGLVAYRLLRGLA